MTGSKPIKQLSKILYFFWILTACATVGGYNSDELDYSLVDIQKVVGESLPTEVGVVSSNGREYYTKVFKQNIESSKTVPLIVKVVVLGASRPYKLSVEVNVVSSRNKSGDLPDIFSNGEPYYGEASLSKRIVTKVQSELAKRRKNKNLFDDFRAF